MTLPTPEIKVLVAVDASGTTQHTIQFLARLRPRWQVTVMHIIDVEAQPHPHLSGGLLQGFHAQLRQQLRAEAEQLLPRLTQPLHSHYPHLDVAVREGGAAEAIVAEARARQVDLIILGSRGLTPIPALVLGSVSYRVIHRAPCSVLLVKRAMPTLNTLLLGLDRTPGAHEAAVFVKASGLVGMAKRTIIATVTSASSLTRTDTEWMASWRETRDGAQTFVQELKQELTLPRHRVEGVVLEGDPAAALLELAQKETVDLLVVGTRGRTGVRRLLLGSVSQKVMLDAGCAVLIVRRPPW
jgi:nucleotide-binding universal stress UspA family protein